MAPVLFNIQDSLLHIEALAMDVSPRLINIEPTLIRLQARALLQALNLICSTSRTACCTLRRWPWTSACASSTSGRR